VVMQVKRQAIVWSHKRSCPDIRCYSGAREARGSGEHAGGKKEIPALICKGHQLPRFLIARTGAFTQLTVWLSRGLALAD